MFCMYCGQELPDGARFCMKCGTPQGQVAPAGASNPEPIAFGGNQTFVPAMCPNCNAHMEVDSNAKIARCNSCGTECLVQDAINTLNVKGNIQVGNATININGTNTDSLLKRVEMMLADGNFAEAKAKCDSILDSEPTNGTAYLYLMLASLNCRRLNELARLREPFNSNPYYLRVIQYCDKRTINEIDGYINNIEKSTHAKQRNPRVGDEIPFGFYNGKKLWWKTLENNGTSSLIIAMEPIWTMPFNEYAGEVKWKRTSLHRWLNNSKSTLFSPSEFSRISGDFTLLSGSDARRYFISDQDRSCGSSWWLQSPGDRYSKAAYVNEAGTIVTSGQPVETPNCGVRPVVRIKNMLY